MTPLLRALRFAVGLAVTLGASVALARPAAAYDAIRPDSPLGRRLAELAARTGHPLAPMLAAPHPWEPPSPSDEELRRRTATQASASPSDAIIAGGAVRFAAAQPMFVGGPLVELASGDLDGDGLPDLVAAGPGATLTVWRHAGSGFASPASYALPATATSVVVGDLDGDGLADIVVGLGAPGTLVLLHGNGDGTLGAPAVIPGVGSIGSLAIGDLDGAGALDLAALEPADSSVVTLSSLGSGSFAVRARVSAPTGAFRIALGDFDGDGRPDVATIGTTDRVPAVHALSVRLNLGDGSLGARADYTTAAQPNGLAIGDLDGDGRAEVAIAPRFGTDVEVFPNVAGTLAASHGVNVRANAFGLVGVSFADVNGDGKLDLVSQFANDDCYTDKCPNASVLDGRGDGTFGSVTSYLVAPADQPSRVMLALHVADVTGDHRPDFVWSNEPSSGDAGSFSQLIVLANRPSGAFTAPVVRPVASGPYALGVGRFRAGATRDLVSSGASAVALVRSRGNGTFDDPVDLRPGALAAVADLDGDGFDDVVVARADTTEILRSNGAGGFAAPVTLVGGAVLALADRSGDGTVDVWALLANGDLGVFENDGTAHFGALLDVGAAPSGLNRVADLDGDGRADLVCVLSTGGAAANDSVRVLWGDDTGFTPGPWLFAGDEMASGVHVSVRDAVVGDFDGDGRLDVGVSKTSIDEPGVLALLRHEGARDFAPVSTMDVGNEPNDYSVSDFDVDGRPDFAVANIASSFTGRTNVLHGIGGGAFEIDPPNGGYAVEHYAVAAASGDFDGDGRPDLAVGCLSAKAIVVLPNVSPPSLPTSVDVALVTVNATSQRVTLSWQLPAGAGSASLERRQVDTDWTSLAQLSADGSGRVGYEDRTVRPGSRYGYRLIAGAVTSGETWVDVPGRAALAIVAASPNPSTGPLNVRFTMASNSRARLELLDVTGRRVRERVIQPTGAGEQRISFSERDGLAPGLYFLRLTQDREAVQSRIAIVR